MTNPPGADEAGAGPPGEAASDGESVPEAESRDEGSRGAAIRAGLRGAGALALAGFLANGANIATTFVLSHLLTTRGYGSFNLLVYLFLVLSMPGYAVVVAVVRQVSRWESTGWSDHVHDWVSRRRWTVLVFVGFALAVSIAAGPAIARGLSLPDASGVAPILTAGAAWMLLSIDRGLIQAHRLYGNMARNLVVEGAVRTAGTLVLVGVGFGVRGAMIAILASAAAADLDARLSLAYERKHRSVRMDSSPDGAEDVLEEILIATSGEAPASQLAGGHASRDFGAALAAMALLASLAGLDIIVLGRMAPVDSGPYAAIAVVSKVLFFAALILSAYLLPEATTRWHRGEHAFHQLAVTLGILAVSAGLECGIAALAARRVLGLVYPARLLADAPDLAELVLAMALLAVTVILTYYLLGIGSRTVVAVLGSGTLLLTVLLVAADGRPASTVHADLAAQGAIVAAVGVQLWVVSRRRPSGHLEVPARPRTQPFPEA